MIEIREPKFRRGDKVVDSINDEQLIVSHVAYYRFCDDNYVYILKRNGGEKFGYEEELHLFPYVEKPETVWDLKDGDYYTLANISGEVSEIHWDGTAVEKSWREFGNCFLTKEEAEFEVERRKIETEMLRLGGRREFKYNDANYCICYNDGLCIESYPCTFNQGGIYFDSVKEAMEVVKTIGDDRIKKYIFGVNK